MHPALYAIRSTRYLGVVMPKPRLLLHACCGVCSAYVPELLMPDFEVSVFYENSNIYPQEEFFRRRDAAKIMAESFSLPFIDAPYRPEDWAAAIHGYENEPERGERCERCIAYRLDRTFAYAKVNGFDIVATTLSVSRRKDAEMINLLGFTLALVHEIEFLGRDWKKANGESLSQERAKAAGIYRQNYCGCKYSLPNKQNFNPSLSLPGSTG
ncbi:MAG: epoxyqueuosine reductase QueH [Patescibacteria group bacterium]